MDYISEVKNQVRLKEGSLVIEKILVAIYINQVNSTKELARINLLPIPVVTAIKKEFIKLGILEQNKGIQLTEAGRDYIENEMGYSGLDQKLYMDLLESVDLQEKIVDELSAEITHIYENRPQVDVTLDQAQCTVKTAINRAILCLEKHSLIGKRILCVGDDDLISVALGFLLKKLYPNGNTHKTLINVFDVDTRFIQYINDTAKEYDLPVECVELDLKEPLPLRYTNVFDCFFTDPPYTVDGMALFLSRGISGLKKERGLKVFLSFGQKPIEETFVMQETILTHGLALMEIRSGYNKYEGASLLGNISQMMILESTDRMKALIPTNKAYDRKIYTREFKNPDSRYQCKACKKILQLGKDVKCRTIEQLKEQGCPECGNHGFDLMKKNHDNQEVPEQKKSLGVHILADFFGCSEKILSSETSIKNYMHEAAKRANATIVSEEFHKFNPWGISGAIIIQESHLTIHTWPEYQYAAVDLFTCGESLDLFKAMEYLKEKLECDSMEYTNVARGVFRLGGVDSSKLMKSEVEMKY